MLRRKIKQRKGLGTVRVEGVTALERVAREGSP